MATNQFLPFAVGAGANALTPTAYAALTALLSSGFQAGTASSAQINTVLRQASTAAAGLGQFIASRGQDALDNGDPAAFKAALEAALIGGRIAVVRTQVFATPGSATYTPHPNMLYAHVEIVGGGGAGGGFINGSNSGGAAGGGGAGAWAVGLFSAATIGASQSVVVGAGGAGSTGNGGNGGTTSFGSLMSASGGLGTAASVAGGATYVAGGAGGSTVSGGYARSNGGGGGAGWGGWVSGVFSGGMGGVGAASRFGGGGAGGGSGTGPAGGSASAPGAGGGGVGGGQNNNAAGGSGAPGIVIVTEYCSQ